MGRVEQEKGVLIMNVHNNKTAPLKEEEEPDTSPVKSFFLILQIVVMMFTWSRSAVQPPPRMYREKSLYVSGQKNTKTENIHPSRWSSSTLVLGEWSGDDTQDFYSNDNGRDSNLFPVKCRQCLLLPPPSATPKNQGAFTRYRRFVIAFMRGPFRRVVYTQNELFTAFI